MFSIKVKTACFALNFVSYKKLLSYALRFKSSALAAVKDFKKATLFAKKSKIAGNSVFDPIYKNKRDELRSLQYNKSALRMQIFAPLVLEVASKR